MSPGNRRSSGRRQKRPNVDTGCGLKWVTANDPADFKKRDTLRQVRTHVMVDYLAKKENCDASSPINITSKDHALPELAPRDCSSTNIISRDRALELYYSGRQSTEGHNGSVSCLGSGFYKRQDRGESTAELDKYAQALRKMRAMAAIDQPLVPPRRDALAPLPYDQAFKYLAPLSYDIGQPLDPFKTLPQSIWSSVNVEELKFNCSRLFGTRAMGVRWVPALLKERHAFLSTLCVASTQLDIMAGLAQESWQTTRLRIEIVHLISQSILNPETQADDATIMAVLQLTCSEIIRGDCMDILWHEDGLERMVALRGGLDHLGVKPDLAVMTTIISVLSAVSRETLPRQLYRDFATKYPPDSFPEHRPIPESPLYCPRELQTIVRSPKKCKAITFDLLSDMSEMIKLFVSANRDQAQSTRHDSVISNNHKQASPERVTNEICFLHKKILALPSASDKGKKQTSGDWVYESCRIAACINSTAIAKNIPLSAAASEVMIQQSYSSHRHAPSSSYSSPPLRQPTLLHALHAALDKSDLSTCWMDHHMTGVLLWISLVGSAAAITITIPTPVPQSPNLEESPSTSARAQSIPIYSDLVGPTPEEHLLRKFIIALAIRCSILLAFEHKGGVIESMNQFLHIGELLGNQPEVLKNSITTISGPSTARNSSHSPPPSLPAPKRRRKA